MNKHQGGSRTDLDPTSAASLQELKRQILAAPEVQNFLANLNATQISLVLSGGGGKGAYEAGVLLALFDCGIRGFAALAGTSVGALNAAIGHEVWRLRDRNLVIHLWGEMSWRKVFRASWLIPVVLLQALLQNPSVEYHSSNPMHSRLASRLRISWEMSHEPAGIRNVVNVAREVLKELLWHLLPWFFALLWFTFVFVLALALAAIDVDPLPFFFAIFLLPPVVPLFVSLLLLTIKRSPSLFSNAPLASAIDGIDLEALRTSKIPIACTATLTLRTPSILERLQRANLLPHYEVLNEMPSRQDVAQTLLQSAALPVIFPERRVRGLWCIDGGLMDNTPILPAIMYGVSQHRMPTLIVVYLDTAVVTGIDLAERERERVKKLARRYELLSEVGTTALSDEIDRLFARCQFIPIIPTRYLGNLVTGTLNFAPSKARELLAMGYQDTLITIKRLAMKARLFADDQLDSFESAS